MLCPLALQGAAEDETKEEAFPGCRAFNTRTSLSLSLQGTVEEEAGEAVEAFLRLITGVPDLFLTSFASLQSAAQGRPREISKAFPGFDRSVRQGTSQACEESKKGGDRIR